MSKETKQKVCNARQKNPLFLEKNPNYKHGNDSRTLRRLIFKRDNWICQDCGHSEKEIMCCDHIKPKAIYPEKQFDLNNLQTLCPNCHARKTIQDKKFIAKWKKRMKSGELLTSEVEDNPEPSVIGI